MGIYDDWKLDNNEDSSYECEDSITFTCEDSDRYEKFREKLEQLAETYGVGVC